MLGFAPLSRAALDSIPSPGKTVAVTTAALGLTSGTVTAQQSTSTWTASPTSSTNTYGPGWSVGAGGYSQQTSSTTSTTTTINLPFAALSSTDALKINGFSVTINHQVLGSGTPGAVSIAVSDGTTTSAFRTITAPPHNPTNGLVVSGSISDLWGITWTLTSIANFKLLVNIASLVSGQTYYVAATASMAYTRKPLTVATLALTPKTILIPTNIGVSTQALNLSPKTIAFPITSHVSAGALALTGNFAKVNRSFSIPANAFHLASPNLKLARSIPIDRGALSLLGSWASASVLEHVTAGSLALASRTMTPRVTLTFPTPATLSLASPTIRQTTSIPMSRPGLSLGTPNAPLARTVKPNPQPLVLTSPTIRPTSAIGMQPGHLTLTPQTLVIDAATRTLMLASAMFLARPAITINAGTRILPATGHLTLTSANVAVNAKRVVAVTTATLTLTSSAVRIGLNKTTPVATSALALTSSAIRLIEQITLPVATASLTLAGSARPTSIRRVTAGALTLSPSTNITQGFLAHTDSAPLQLNGGIIVINGRATLEIPSTAFVLAGNPVSVIHGKAVTPAVLTLVPSRVLRNSVVVHVAPATLTIAAGNLTSAKFARVQSVALRTATTPVRLARNVPIAPGSLTLTASDTSKIVPVISGALHLTGKTVRPVRLIKPTPAALALTAVPTWNVGIIIQPSSGRLVLAHPTIRVVRAIRSTRPAIVLTPSARISVATVVRVATASLGLTGGDVFHRNGVPVTQPVQTSLLTLTASPVTITRTRRVGLATLTLTSRRIKTNVVAEIAPATLTLGPSAITSRVLAHIGRARLRLTASKISLPRSLIAPTTPLTLTPQPVTLSVVTHVERGSILLTGNRAQSNVIDVAFTSGTRIATTVGGWNLLNNYEIECEPEAKAADGVDYELGEASF